jgi:hypothetical protein
LGPNIHPSDPSEKEVDLRSSWEVPSMSSAALYRLWVEFDEKEMKSFTVVGFMVGMASLGYLTRLECEKAG